MNTKLWYLIKTTLIEKDGTTTSYGSIKRWGAWILFFYCGLIILAGLLPSGSINWAWCHIQLSWHHCAIDIKTLSALLEAIGTYILGGATISAVSSTVQNFHNQKYSGIPPTPTNA